MIHVLIYLTLIRYHINLLFHTNGIIIPYCNVGKSIERESFEASSFDLFLK